MSEERIYLVQTDRGTWSNHLDAHDERWGGLIGGRVIEATATHYTAWSRGPDGTLSYDGLHELHKN